MPKPLINADIIAEARRLATIPTRADPVTGVVDVTERVLLNQLAIALGSTEQQRDEAVAREAGQRKALGALLTLQHETEKTFEGAYYAMFKGNEAWRIASEAYASPSPAAERLLAQVKAADVVLRDYDAWVSPSGDVDQEQDELAALDRSMEAYRATKED